ncbi:MAG: hypothetical protein EBS86_09895 [Crocinitomicaceae bacterium]|nr:hypothetical protein [Crocinitomicaceae bacterium]
MDTLDNQLTSDQSLSSTSKQALLTASKWAKFLSIIGFIGIGLMALGLFFLLRNIYNSPTVFGQAKWHVLIVFMYLIFAGLNFFPVYYLLQFSNKIRTGIDNSDNISVEEGFVNLKSLFKFMGITTIVVISTYILAIIFMIGAFIFKMSELP